MLRGAAAITVLSALALGVAIPACQNDTPPLPNSVPGPPVAPLSPEAVALLWPPTPDPSAAIPLSPRASASLAADLAMRMEAAKAEPDRPHRVIPVAGTFLLADGDDAAPLDAAVDLATRLVGAAYSGAFAHRPEKSVTVWIYGSGPFFKQGVNDHTRWFWIHPNQDPGFGLFDEHTRAIVVRTDTGGVQTLNHELLHVLADSDYPTAPTWLAEGMASLGEVTVLAKSPDGTHDVLRFGAHFRLQTLRDAIVKHDPATMDALRVDSMFTWRTPTKFHDPGLESLHYAVSREVLRFALQKGKLWDFWHAARDHADEDPTAEKAFTRIMGKPADVTAEFLAWVQSKEAEGT